MKLDMKNEADKQKIIAAGLILVILIAGFLVLKPMLFSGASNESADTSAGATVPPPADQPPPPGGENPQAVTPAPGAPPPQPGAAPPPPGAAPSPAPASPQPGAPAPQGPTASAPTTAPAPAQSAPPVSSGSSGQKTLTVFGSVTLTYPNGWGIGLGSIGSAAVVSDGKARFEIRAPNPKADTAKAIADAALATLGGNSKVISQGPMKIGGFDAYQYTTGAGKIIGVDAPKRVVIVKSVKGGNLSAYRATFDKMESQLSFR